MSKLERPPLIDHKMIDFKVKREPWNIYKVEDGSILKAKFVLIMVHFEKDVDELISEIKSTGKIEKMEIGTGVNIKNQMLVGASAPNNLMGVPNERKGLNYRDYIVEEDLDFEVIKENFFEYQLENGFNIKGKAVLMNIDRTSLYENSGMPIYLVDHTIEAKIKPPKKLRDLIRPSKKKA